MAPEFFKNPLIRLILALVAGLVFAIIWCLIAKEIIILKW